MSIPMDSFDLLLFLGSFCLLQQRRQNDNDTPFPLGTFARSIGSSLNNHKPFHLTLRPEVYLWALIGMQVRGDNLIPSCSNAALTRYSPGSGLICIFFTSCVALSVVFIAGWNIMVCFVREKRIEAAICQKKKEEWQYHENTV